MSAGIFSIAREAWAAHREAATQAFDVFLDWSPNLAGQSRVPGMPTEARLAVRIEQGCSPAEAAGREYLYRWNLTLGAIINHVEAGSKSQPMSIWPAPHAWGL